MQEQWECLKSICTGLGITGIFDIVDLTAPFDWYFQGAAPPRLGEDSTDDHVAGSASGVSQPTALQHSCYPMESGGLPSIVRGLF